MATTIEGIEIVCYTVLPMGLKVSSSEYQHVMDVTFSGIDVGQETHYVHDFATALPKFCGAFLGVGESFERQSWCSDVEKNVVC